MCNNILIKEKKVLFLFMFISIYLISLLAGMQVILEFIVAWIDKDNSNFWFLLSLPVKAFMDDLFMDVSLTATDSNHFGQCILSSIMGMYVGKFFQI